MKAYYFQSGAVPGGFTNKFMFALDPYINAKTLDGSGNILTLELLNVKNKYGNRAHLSVPVNTLLATSNSFENLSLLSVTATKQNGLTLNPSKVFGISPYTILAGVGSDAVGTTGTTDLWTVDPNAFDDSKAMRVLTINTAIATLFNQLFATNTNALNSTGNITSAMIAGKIITTTSASPVTGTLPTAAALASVLGAQQGSMYEFVVDNSAGANTFTVAVNTGITAPSGAITGGNSLTVTTGNSVGIFRIYFTSTTTAEIFRIA